MAKHAKHWKGRFIFADGQAFWDTWKPHFGRHARWFADRERVL